MYCGWPFLVLQLCILCILVNFASNPLVIVSDSFKTSTGVHQSFFGTMMALGCLAYAVGKITNGYTARLIKGRWNLMISFLGAGLCELGITLVDHEVLYVLIWCTQRFVLSFAYIGLIHLIQQYVPIHMQGKAFAAVHISFCIGDSLDRFTVSLLLGADLNWVGVVRIGGMIGILIGVFTLSLPPVNPQPEDKLVIPYPILKSRRFLLLCLIYFQMNFACEFFNVYAVSLYMNMGMTEEEAAAASGSMSIGGMTSTIIIGISLDALLDYPLKRVFVLPSCIAGASLLCFVNVVAFSSNNILLVNMCMIGFAFATSGAWLCQPIICNDMAGENGATLVALADACAGLGAVLNMTLSGLLEYPVLLWLVFFDMLLAVFVTIPYVMATPGLYTSEEFEKVERSDTMDGIGMDMYTKMSRTMSEETETTIGRTLSQESEPR